jgi:hypothetical protein
LEPEKPYHRVTCYVDLPESDGGFKTQFRGVRCNLGDIGPVGNTRFPVPFSADAQNGSIGTLTSGTAGETGGAREGRPRYSRIFPMVSVDVLPLAFIGSPRRAMYTCSLENGFLIFLRIKRSVATVGGYLKSAGSVR